MLEIMNCLAGLAGQLLQEQEWLAPLLQQSVRRQAQRIAELLSAAIAKPSLPRRVSIHLCTSWNVASQFASVIQRKFKAKA